MQAYFAHGVRDAYNKVEVDGSPYSVQLPELHSMQVAYQG